MKNSGIRHDGCLLIASAIGILFLWCFVSLPAFAEPVKVQWDWEGGDGVDPNWSISENWDGGQVPLPGDNVYIQNGTYVNYDDNYDVTSGIATLTIDNDSVLALLSESQTLTVGLGNPAGGSLIVGDTSTGTIGQEGGEVNINASSDGLVLGNQSGSEGNYYLGYGNLTVNGTEIIGKTGIGFFTQEGGTHTVETLIIGSNGIDSEGNPISGTGTYEMQSGTLNAANVDNNGTFLFEGGSLNVFNEFVNTGLFQGKGDADTAVFINSGTVEIGDSPGELSFNGDYIQTSEGVLVIELGGYESGMEFDFLNIDGSAELGGELRITLWDGFIPASGSQFDIMYVVNGILNDTIFNQYDLPLGWNWEIEYLNLFDDGDNINETVRLTANSVPVPATFWLLGTGLIAFVGICRRVDGRINQPC